MKEPSLEKIFGNYTAWEAKEGTWFINFMNGSENMYLLEGKEKALLLDTGYGAGNLRAFVEKLTDKPVIVANTHYHPDHAAGNGEFEEAYMSEGALIDAPSVEAPGAVPFDLSKLLQAELGITRSDIYQIRVHDKYSFVTMSEENCGKAIEKLNNSTINGRVAKVTYSEK